MEIRSAQRGNACVVVVGDARIDASVATAFKDAVRDQVGPGDGRVLLDLQNVEFLDSSGLGAVVALMKLLGQDRRLELAGLRPAVDKVFRLTRMDSVFTIHESVDTAFAEMV